MKAIPVGKVEISFIWCQECEFWYQLDECSSSELVAVHDDEHQFDSDYDERHYYSSWFIKTVHQCPEGCWIWDPNDGDVDTPHKKREVPWQCGNCHGIHPDRDSADECCPQ